MIEIIGDKDTSEYSAALAIAGAIEKMWPGISKSPVKDEHIKIAANVKISGYKVSDIDIVLCGVFYKERRFKPNKTINSSDAKKIFGDPVTVQNIIVVVEVKDHPDSSIRQTSDNISVKYKNGWKSATDQNVKQVHSLDQYIKDKGGNTYIHRCIYLGGIPSIDCGGAIGSQFSGVDFFTSIARVSRVLKSSNGYTLSSGSNLEIHNFSNSSIFKTIIPSALDRRRMDMIVASTQESEELLKCLGKKMIIARGRGGTGKTIMFLQMAYKAYQQKGMRTLILTYNHALASDIRRLLALLNIPTEVEKDGIVVETVMSFICSWLYSFQIINKESEDLYQNYESYCSSLLDLIKAEAITVEDIKNVINNQPDRYDFDCVMADESQDWPQSEATLLASLYPKNALCLADGVDQLLRGGRTNWDNDIKKEDKVIISLSRSLRMKRNLAFFANGIAHQCQISWKVAPNDLAGGGRVVILDKPYSKHQKLHEILVDNTKDKGNSEIDFLFCIPTSDKTMRNGKYVSNIGDYLINSGQEIWNGIDEIERKNFPRSKSQFRIVHYESCRGLEGWTVVLQNADIYWEECLKFRKLEGLTEQDKMAFKDIDQVAFNYAWQRMMISLTRPIDTLVITLNDLNSEFSKTILKVAKLNPDFVETIYFD